jgi:hypothetical protein
MLKAIVGIEIVIERVEAKAKLSQNKTTADAMGAVTELELGGPADNALVAAMRAVTSGPQLASDEVACCSRNLLERQVHLRRPESPSKART